MLYLRKKKYFSTQGENIAALYYINRANQHGLHLYINVYATKV